MRLISDKKLMKIAIKDNREPLVNLKDFNKKIVVELEEISRKTQKLQKDDCFVRKTVALKLSEAQSALSISLKFKIIDGYRSMEAQKIIYFQMFNEIQKKYPKWSLDKIETETDKWVANPKIVPFHTTGGAVDLTIIDDFGNEFNMGNPINTASIVSRTDFSKISKEAKKNRGLLVKAMTSAGFVNYPLEWWHWSYGDRYWAAVNKTYSIYGAI